MYMASAALKWVGSAKRSNAIGPFWHGWSSIEDWFAFGDSWTDVHFDYLGERPSASNPIGNPAFPGWTSSNGPNYVGYLVSKYNESTIRLTDFAISGSVINPDVVTPMFSWLNFGLQTERFKQFGASFDPQRALFSIWFGINDVSCYNKANPQLDVIKKTYIGRVGELYQMGARNFLILNVPPIDIISKSQDDPYVLPEDVALFNNMIKEIEDELTTLYGGVTVFSYDVHDLFGKVISSGSFKNTTQPCPDYAGLKFGVDPAVPTAEDEKACGVKLEDYLWLDSLHITWPMHEKIADGIYDLLKGQTSNDGDL